MYALVLSISIYYANEGRARDWCYLQHLRCARTHRSESAGAAAVRREYASVVPIAHITWGTESLNLTHQHDSENSSESSRIMLEKWDPASQTEQRFLESNTSSAEQTEAQKPSPRRATVECTSPCLNGGWCVHPDSCNCTLYQATGTHCQTVPNLGFEREMTCRSWGQYNYETFDGLYYYFPGKCSYTLVRDCEDSIRSSVHIQVHNDPECSSFSYSCKRSISLFLPWEGEIRLQNFSVTFKGQSVQLPHHIHDVELERISDYILVSQPQGFTLAWQGLTGSVYIKMSPEFVGHTCGLCGNFNADTQDDLKTSYGNWAEEDPQLGRCPVVPSLYPSPCATQDPRVLLKVEEVCAALLKEPFQSCHEFVSPYSYMASCSNDLCQSGPNGDVVCQVFTEYARACAHAGHPLHTWRAHFPVCSVDCPGELLFRECINCCPMHCKIEHMCIDSKLQCLDGCYCPDGNLIYENGVCVKASDCPCEHHGMLYPSGHIIQEDCNNCTCVGGIWNCTEHSCPAKSRNSGKFTVTIQNAPCGANLDGACIQSINLVVDEDPRTEITMSHSGEVLLASQFRISLPYSDVRIHTAPFAIKSSQGLRLQYNWREFRLYLQLEEHWRDDTVGLCGTFNGNIQDDFLAPSGMIESTPHLFGNAWRVSSACVPRPSLPQLDPCDTHQQAATYAVEKCDVLTQEVFSACHEYVSPVGFQLQCRADPCGDDCEEGCVCPEGTYFNMHTHTCVPRSECPCSFLGADYSPGDVIMTSADTLCPPGQFYEDCGNRVDGHSANKGLACEQTCESYLLNLTCSVHEPCVPGCVCPAGLLKHGDECFEPHACPCLWKGKEYYPGDRVSSPCHHVCQHGTFQCEFRPCPSMCTAYGDRHYRTFDGFLFDYIGACKVYLVKSSLDAMLTVTAENVDCFESGVICRKSLLISLGRSFIVFDDDSGKPKVYIWQAGYYTIVHLLGEDLTVLWDRKTTVHIQAGPSWQGKLTGLCGNFDQKTANEMRTPENIDSPDIRHPCNLNPLREPFAKRQCGILLSEVFQVCHPVVDVTWFYMNCLVDTCGCNRGGDCECFCTSVAAYAHRCCQKGVTIDWRSPSVCPNKTSGLVFPKREITSTDEILTMFMMTPGISKARPHDTSLVSFEAADRPNYFLKAERSGQLGLQKWEETEGFWDAATFVLHRDTWISGFDSLESLAKPGFFLNFMLSRLQLVKYSHSDRYRRATLFKLTGAIPHYPMGPRCQWRYESCVSPCFRTCSDPSGLSCASILKVEGCLPQCPSHMVLDEPAVVPPPTPTSTVISSTFSSEYSTLSGPAVSISLTSSTVSASSTTASTPTAHMPSTTKLTSSPVTPEVVETITTLTTSTSSPSPLASTERTTKAPSITHSSTSSTTLHTSPMFISETLPGTSTTSRPTVSLTLLTLTTTVPSPSTSSPVLSSTSSKEPTRISTLPVLPVSTSISYTEATSPTVKVSSPLTSSTETPKVSEAFTPTEKTTAHFETSSGSTQLPVETIITTKSTSPSTTTPILELSTSVTTEKWTFPTSLHTVKTSEGTTETQKPLDTTTISTSPTDIEASTTHTAVKSTSSAFPTQTTPFIPLTLTSEQPKTSKTTVFVSTAAPTTFITTVSSQAPTFVSTETTAKTTYQPTSDIYPHPDVPTTDRTLQTDWRVIQTMSTPLPETTQTSAKTAETPVTTYTTMPFTSAPTEETSTLLTSHVSPTDKTTYRVVSTSTTLSPTESHWSLVSTTAVLSDKVSTSPVHPPYSATTMTTTSALPLISQSSPSTLTMTTSVSQAPTVTTETTVTSERPLLPSTAAEKEIVSTTQTSTSRPFSIHSVTETTRLSLDTDRAVLSTDTTTETSTLVHETSSTFPSTMTQRFTTRVTPVLTSRVAVATTRRETPRVVATTSISPPTRTTPSTTSTDKVTTVFTDTTTSSIPVATSSTLPTHSPETFGFTEYTTESGPTTTLPTSSGTTPVPGVASVVTQTTISTQSATSSAVTESRPVTSASASTERPLVDEYTRVTAMPPAPDTGQTTLSSSAITSLPYTTETEHWMTSQTHAVSKTTALEPSRVCTSPYSEVVDECTKLICVSGQLLLFNKSQSCPYDPTPPNCGLLGFAVLVNGDKCCPRWDCPCRCSVFPDLNLITFDGKSVAIYKAALYVVTRLPNETVSILVQECSGPDDTLVWNFTNLCLAALNITHKSNEVLINRLQRRLYVNSRYSKPRFKKFGFEILDTGNMYLIRSPAGLKIQWFHTTGMMVIEMDSYNNRLPTMGLCGSCDGNPLNDLTLSNGTVVSEQEDPAVFIDSWQIPNTTSYVSHSRRREVNCTTDDCSQCMSMLSNRTFTICHPYVPPVMFCEMWVRDVEYHSCAQKICSTKHVCRPALPHPAQTKSLSLSQSNAQACQRDVCVQRELFYTGPILPCAFHSATCTDSFGTPRALGEIWKASVDGCCMYKCENDSIVPVEYNCSNIPQPVCTRTGEITVNLADDSSCCPQKACVCNQSKCEAAPTDCNYGEKLVSYHREDSCCPEYLCECDPDQCVLDIPVCREDQTLIATRAEGSCCLAHICMCDKCSEAVPVCQDGELLIVDTNSTERCCPVYHCLCETSRCLDITCPVGMAVVSTRIQDQCCPSQTCECACEKMLRPKCALGESIQLDRSFLSDPENRLMRPGQTLVEHRDQGVCYTKQCTHTLDSATGFYLLKATGTNCTSRCQPNQIYIPPKDPSSCCGVCKNISCLIQRRSWVSDCMRYDCMDTLSGPVLVSHPYSCPPFNETECMKIGGTVVSYMDGCCKTCAANSLFPFSVSPLKPTVSTNCEQGKEDGKSCQKVTVRMTIRKNDCRSNRPVNIVSCDGKCPSASIYNYNINTYARFCKCCREMGLQRRSVQLYCSGNSTWYCNVASIKMQRDGHNEYLCID
ncbi:Otogelin [Labeo rohita]|uniref:Otogelin n=1 Tax=Labeo rohita TaxID=84645 RepID=A0ABQ8MI40_LABRO|nr:Otogelin [Labeo rohita]